MSPEGSSHQTSQVPAKEWDNCVLRIPSLPSVAVVSITVQQVHNRLRRHVNIHDLQPSHCGSHFLVYSHNPKTQRGFRHFGTI